MLKFGVIMEQRWRKPILGYGAVVLFAWLGAGCATLLDAAKRPFADSRAPITVTTVGLNVRKGPGMSHRIVAVLPRGAPVDVLGEQRGWRRVAIQKRGKVSEGWVAAKYLKTEPPPPPPDAKPVVSRPTVVASKPSDPEPPRPRRPEPPAEPGGAVPLRLPDPPRTEVTALESNRPIDPLAPPARPSLPPPVAAKPPDRPPAPSAGPSRIEPGPYAEEVRPLRDALAEKRFADAEAKLAILQADARRKRDAAQSPAKRFLSLLERGSVDLDRGRLESSIRRFEEASELAAKATEAVDESEEPGGFFFGRKEKAEAETLSPYRPTAFERVWIGNTLALGHLLNGDRETGEIALAEIDRQEELERAFEEELRKLEESLRGERDRLGEADADAVQEIVEREYAASALRAEAAPSSFESPFAHYVAGVAQELEARDRPELREDALASYAKALALAPTNDLFRAAVDDLSVADPFPDDRLVHVLIAEGFVPEKKALAYELSMPGRSVEVRLPVLSPLPSPVGGAHLTIDGTQTAMPLAMIADVEAMALRYERDRTPERAIAVLSVVPEPPRTASVGGIADWIGRGDRTSALATAVTPPPDTASWMTLPARYYAARLRLSKEPHKLKISLLDQGQSPIDAVDVTLDPVAHGFVYVRTAGRILTTRARSPDWFAGRTAR